MIVASAWCACYFVHFAYSKINSDEKWLQYNISEDMAEIRWMIEKLNLSSTEVYMFPMKSNELGKTQN